MRMTLVLDASHCSRARAWAERDGVSVDEWLAAVIDREDSRRRCDAHNAWLRDNPEIAEALAAQERAAERGLTT